MFLKTQNNTICLSCKKYIVFKLSGSKTLLTFTKDKQIQNTNRSKYIKYIFKIFLDHASKHVINQK